MKNRFFKVISFHLFLQYFSLYKTRNEPILSGEQMWWHTKGPVNRQLNWRNNDEAKRN